MTSRFNAFVASLGAALLLVGAAAPASAAAPDSRPSDPRAAANQGVIGVVSGGVDGTYVRIASDLAAVLDREGLRVLPIVSRGSMQNLSDLMYLRGVDVGIVQSDVLAYAKRRNLYPGIERHIQYVAKLYNEELHVLAGPEIRTIEDLAGKPVNFDTSGSGGFMTASVVFETLGVKAEPTTYDHAMALEKLRRHEIAAMIYVAGKPARLFKELPADSGLHFVAVPPKPELLETYLPSRLTSEDYPSLVAADAPVPTVAVGAVMAVYGQRPGSERYRNLASFVESFFGRLADFQQAPRHPKWKEVNLAARVPGWTRFAPAEEWLRHAVVAGAGPGAQQLKGEFDSFLAELSGGGKPVAAAQKNALFAEFLRGRDAQPTARQ
jgi:TRAP transporter TAXI family solute receptor